jgi:Tfp pilus assembly protein PilO
MAGSFVMFVLWPKQRELSALGSAVARQRELVEEKVIASQTGQLMAFQMPEIRRARKLLERRLPPEPRLADFLQVLAQRIAEEPRVTHEVKRSSGNPAGPVPGVPIRLRLVGPFAAVQQCVTAIEGMDRLCRFSQTHLARTDNGCVAAEAEILVYYLPPGNPDEPEGGEASPESPSAEEVRG